MEVAPEVDDMQAHHAYYQRHDPSTYYAYIKVEKKKKLIKFGLACIAGREEDVIDQK